MVMPTGVGWLRLGDFIYLFTQGLKCASELRCKQDLDLPEPLGVTIGSLLLHSEPIMADRA